MLNFFKSGIWTLRTADFSPFLRGLVSALRIIVLSVRCFFKNNCMLHASALTYYTLLAIVPVAALAFAIAKGFGLYARLETWFRGTFAGKEEVAEKIITFSNNLLENTKGGLIAGIGAIALLYVTIRLMMQIEKSLNDIWGVKTGRAILRKISDYLAIVLLCPLIIIVTTGATVYTTVRLSEMVNTIPGISDTMNALLALSSRALHIVNTWLIFSFIYMFIPNTRVRIIPALTGGFIAGVLYYIAQYLCFALQYNVAKYNAIYGSFAALPLFLIWLQISWTFILLGAEIAFACQNVSSYEGTPGDGSVGSRRKTVYAVKLVRACAHAFLNQQPPLTDTGLSGKLEIPVRTTRLLLYELCDAGILVKVAPSERGDAFQVALPPEDITPVRIMRALQEPAPDEGLDDTDPVCAEIEAIWKSAELSPVNRNLAKN